MALTILFFLYIAVPNFPQNDVLIALQVGIFSILSGYFSVLCYEYAAMQFDCKAFQAYAGTIMNLTFQVGSGCGSSGSRWW